MDSFLTTFLNSKATNLSRVINKKMDFVRPYHFTTASLVFNATALMNLINNHYPLFVFLFLISYFLNICDKVYAKEFDYNTKLTKYYRNVASWIIIMSLYFTFTGLYKYKISTCIITLVIILLIMCNLNYMLRNYNKQNKCIELWDICIKSVLNEKKLLYLRKFTKYVDDSMIIIYLIIIMTFLYYIN
jgi:hypothetical protein